MQIVEFGVPHQPRPVEIGVGHEHPDEPLDDARVKIRRPQAAQHDLGGVPAFAAPWPFCESVVAECRQGACGAGGVESIRVGSGRECRGRHVEHTRHRFSERCGHGTRAALEQADVALRDTETGRQFGLRPVTSGAGALQLEAGHGIDITTIVILFGGTADVVIAAT